MGQRVLLTFSGILASYWVGSAAGAVELTSSQHYPGSLRELYPANSLTSVDAGVGRNQQFGAIAIQPQAWQTTWQSARLVDSQGNSAAIVLQLGIFNKPITTSARATYWVYALRDSEKIELYRSFNVQPIQNADGTVALPPEVIPIQLMQAKLGQEANLADQTLQVVVEVRYDLPNGEQNLGLSLDRTQRYSAIATTTSPQLVKITPQSTAPVPVSSRPTVGREASNPQATVDNATEPTLSATPPEPPPVALVALNNGLVTVNLINNTGAAIDYQVLGDTDSRQLAGRSQVSLQNLQSPFTLSFRRLDGGLLIPRFSSKAGELAVQLEATTNFSLDRTVLEIDERGRVFSK